MDDGEFQEIHVLTPMRHNRWAVIVPALNFMANVAADAHQLLSQYTQIGAQHGMQMHYDRQFKEMTDEYSGEGIGPWSVQSED